MMENFSANPEAPVLVVGSAGIDIVGRIRGELDMGTSNPAVIRMSYGGVARNVAENLARLGHPVILLSAVGQEDYGEQLLEHARSAGINTDFVQKTGNFPTGSYAGILGSRGELHVAMDDMRIVSALTPAYLQSHYDLFRDASVLFIDANLPKESLRKAFSLARRAKLPICADPTSYTLARRLRPYLDRLKMVVPNAQEAKILCGVDVKTSTRRQSIDAAKCLVSQGVSLAIITLAQLGVCYATSETSGQIQAIRTEIVDPTGAGDALTAAVIFALLNNIPLDDAIRLGVSAASLTLRYSGAVVPNLSLDKLYDQLVI